KKSTVSLPYSPGLLSAHVADLFIYISIRVNVVLDGAAALVGDPDKALQIDGTALCVAGLGLVAVRLMHNRLILFAGRLLFLLRRRRGRSGFGFLFTVGKVNVYLIFFLHIQNSIGLVLAVSSFGLRGVRHHYQRLAGAAVRG